MCLFLEANRNVILFIKMRFSRGFKEFQEDLIDLKTFQKSIR